MTYLTSGYHTLFKIIIKSALHQRASVKHGFYQKVELTFKLFQNRTQTNWVSSEETVSLDSTERFVSLMMLLLVLMIFSLFKGE